MILAQGARGPGFNPRSSPSLRLAAMSEASSSALAASRRAVRCAGEIPAVGGEAGGGCGLALWRAFLGPQRFREATEAKTCGLATNFKKLTFFFFSNQQVRKSRVFFLLAQKRRTPGKRSLTLLALPTYCPSLRPSPPTKLPRRTARRHSGAHRAETFQPSGAKLWGGCKAFGRAGGLARRSRRSLRFPWGAPRGDIPAVGRDARAGCKAFGRARGASPAIAEVFALSLGRSSATVVVFGLFLKLSGCLV